MLGKFIGNYGTNFLGGFVHRAQMVIVCVVLDKISVDLVLRECGVGSGELRWDIWVPTIFLIGKKAKPLVRHSFTQVTSTLRQGLTSYTLTSLNPSIEYYWYQSSDYCGARPGKEKQKTFADV